MQTRQRHAAAVVITILLSASLPGRTVVEAQQQDLNLFTRCAPMRLIVEELSEEVARDIGLTEEAIVNAVESRLRAARLFDPDVTRTPSTYLYVQVSLVGRAFSISIQLKRWLLDTGFGLPGSVSVWDEGSTGTYGSAGGQFVLGWVSKHLDSFLTEYLRANEDACAAK